MTENSVLVLLELESYWMKHVLSSGIEVAGERWSRDYEVMVGAETKNRRSEKWAMIEVKYGVRHGGYKW